MSLFTPGLFTAVAILVLLIFFLSSALPILKEYERGVIFRLGRIIKAKGPGLIINISPANRTFQTVSEFIGKGSH